jgi:hypothetical protein
MPAQHADGSAMYAAGQLHHNQRIVERLIAIPHITGGL